MSGSTSNLTITSANAVIFLTFVGLYPPTQLQGFMADDIFDTDDVDPAEVVLGADGLLSGGWLPVMTPQRFSLMPNSPSAPLFENVVLAQNAAQTIYQVNGTIALPAIRRKYSMLNGYLTKFKSIPDAKKVLQGRQFQITWNTVSPVPF